MYLRKNILHHSMLLSIFQLYYQGFEEYSNNDNVRHMRQKHFEGFSSLFCLFYIDKNLLNNSN